MASKTHVDNTVNERRLRPIYDWLDNGNNKKALQEADKVLRKQPSNQCARVLKALALLRLGKEDECLVIMDKVRSEIPCEDSTLQAMSICYREIHQPGKISEVYEAAVKVDPNNEELLTHLFMSYVRLGDFKKQQQTALALYKLKRKNPYYFWAVMSIVMQAIHSDEKIAKEVTLPLAERMVLKLVNKGKMDAEQEVQLYMMILELQGKDEEMLKVLDGPLGSRLSSVPQRKAGLLLKLQRYPEAADAYKELIIQENDNWAYYKDYLTASLQFQTAEECLAFLNEIGSKANKKVRAPHLAKFELIKRTTSSTTILDTMATMREYFEKFGEKGCIVGDLKLYLDLLSEEQRRELISRIHEDVGVGETDFPVDVKQMERHIHLEQLKRICGFHHSPLMDLEQRKKLVSRLCELYDKGNVLCPVEDRLPTDFCPADPYVLLAGHLLHQLWVETKDASHLYRSMILLERALLYSRANFHIKLLLVRTYLEGGFIRSASDAFSLLDVKHIQNDSLGYVHAPLLAPLGDLLLASTVLENAAKYYVGNYKDSADHLTFAYKYGSFVKIQEFVDLRERLENSIHFAMTTADKMILELSWCESPNRLLTTLASMHIKPSEDSIRWEKLRDNRDLDVVVGWEPMGKELVSDPHMYEETRECLLRLLSGRSLILRIIAAAAENESTELLVRLAAEMKHLERVQIPATLRKFEGEGGADKAANLLVPIDGIDRLREAHESEQFCLVGKFTSFLANSSYPNEDCIEALKTSPSLKSLPIPEQNASVSFKRFMLRASTCGETLAIICAICTACASHKKSGGGQKKGKKKNTGGKVIENSSPVERQSWVEVGTVLAERIKELDDTLGELEKIELEMGDLEKNTTSLEDCDYSEIFASTMQDIKRSVGHGCRSLKARVMLTSKLVSCLKS